MNLDLPIEVVGPEDLLPPAPQPSKQSGSIVKRISERHRRLAQCLAEGMAPGEAGIICGYVGSRVSVLQTDPSFKALIEFYRAQREEQFIGAARKLAQVAETSLDILQDRLEDEPDKIGTGQLLAIIQTSTDRIGLGPTQKHEHLHAHLSSEDIAKLKREVLGSSAKLVELLPQQSRREGPSPASGLPVEDSPLQEGSAEEGPSVRETRSEATE